MSPKFIFRLKNAAYFLSIIALLSAVLVYLSTISMGFLDGHLTEFERVTKPLLMGYSVAALLFGILFFGLARFSSKTYSTIVFYVGLALFVFLVIGFIVRYVYFNAHLEHGGGG